MTTDRRQRPHPKRGDHVRERLLTSIRSGTLQPGDPLPSERELMREHGVGRPAIREAMQSLQSAGLVEIRHGERARVAEPSLGRLVDRVGDTMRYLLLHSAASLEHLKEARTTFEVEMVRVAARRRRDRDLDRLREILEAQAAARDDPARFLELDGRFHQEIASLSDNPIFVGLSEAVFGWLADFHVDLVRVPGLEQLTLAEHRAIYEAIEAQDVNRAAKAMSDHLTRANQLYHRTHLGP